MPRGTQRHREPESDLLKVVERACQKSASLSPKSLIELDILLNPLESDLERLIYPCWRNYSVWQLPPSSGHIAFKQKDAYDHITELKTKSKNKDAVWSENV